MNTHTLEYILDTVCTELNVPVAELSVKVRRSSGPLTIARQLCTYFAKKYTTAKNGDIQTALSYDIKDNKIIGYNVGQVENAIKTSYDLIAIPFRNITEKLSGNKDRLHMKGDKITIAVPGPNLNEEQLQKLLQKGIYPFKLQICECLLDVYGINEDGGYSGQTKDQYEHC